MDFTAYHGIIVNDPFGAGRLTRSDVSPVESLPVEILQEIFVMTRGSNPFKYIKRRVKSSASAFDTTPLAIAQTCSKWRTIGLSTPRLWAAFYSRCTSRNHAPYAKLYLERSKSAPLVLRIERESLETNADYSRQEAMKSLLGLWAPHADRWDDIDFDFGRDYSLLSFHEFLNIPRANLVNVRRANIRPLDHYANVWDAVYSTPRTEIANWTHRKLQPYIKHVPVERWLQIRELTLNEVTLEKILSLLPSFHRLEALTIEDLQLSQNYILPDEPQHVSLPMLHTLSVKMNRPEEDEASIFLRKIIAPRLSSLKIIQAGKEDSGTIQAFLSRSGCKLRRLTLNYQNPDEEVMVETLLKATQLLRSLEWCHLRVGRKCSGMTKRIIQVFSPEGVHLRFPSLLELFLYDCNVEDGLLGQVLQERRERGSSLVAFNCHFREQKDTPVDQHVKDMEMFEELVKKGLLMY